VAESNAQRIAADQIGKLYGQLDSFRQQEAGVREFEWATMGDNRVRDSHSDLEGQVFAWDSLPLNKKNERIQPGSEIRCRCMAKPVLDEFTEE
jgi:SPP1 gp7 family putative phage head morphogenesis protein